MNDCTRTAALLDVYADAEASAETNALVHDHLEGCERCARELRAIVAMRAHLREALGRERAPAALRSRIVAAARHEPRGSIVEAVRRWLAPAAAAGLALVLYSQWDPAADPLVAAAVEEHVICALNGRAVRVADAVASARGYSAAMPWIRDLGDVRVVDAHTCGEAHTFSHLVLASPDSTASIFILQRRGLDHPPGPVQPVGYGGFEVSEVTTTQHSAYVIVPRRRAGGAPAWRASALDRVERFLQQLEGSL